MTEKVPDTSLSFESEIETKRVYATTNYEQFHYDKANRPIDHRKVARMVTSMTDDGNWLHLYPITVYQDGKVEDGQHRLEAAKILGVPIHFIISEMGVLKVGLLTRNTDKWTTEDFLNHYVVHGLESYVWIDEFLNRHQHMTLAAVISTIRGRVGEPMYDAVRSGRLVLTDDHKEILEQVATLSLAVKPYLPVLYRVNGVQQALRIMLENGRFEPERLIDQFVKTGRTVFRQPTIHDYVRELESIYNYGFSVNRVNFLESRSNH